MRLKTLFLMEDLCFGGTQKQTLALANGLDRSRFAPQILTLTGPSDLDGAAATDIPLSHLGAGRGVHPFFFLKAGAAIKKLAPDILILCTALPNIWGRLWGRALRVPVILGTCRGGGAPARQHERLLWRLASHIVCNSSALIEAMRGKGAPDRRLSLIPNGVDCARFHPAEKKEGPPLVLCVARLAPDKDLPSLLAAFEILARENSAVRLRIVGEGSGEKRLKEILGAMPEDISARVELSGASADPAPHYRDADIFALSSIREGQPNAILEAMSSALPVCATSAGGIPELVREGRGGFLSPPGSPAALAENMKKLLKDPASRREMGAFNRSRALREFSFKKMISSHEELLESLWSRIKG